MGQQFARRLSQDGGRRALQAFEKSVALDPGSSAAWASLALACLGQVGNAGLTAARDRRLEQRALDAAERAIALDPRSAEGYHARGLLRTAFLWDWAGAKADLERGLSLSPNSSGLWASHARLFAELGKLDEAIAEQRTATELDPLDAEAWFTLGFWYRSAGKLALARSAMTRALEISPELDNGRCGLGLIALHEGAFADALERFRECPNEKLRLQGEALALHSLGRRVEAQRSLDRLIKRYREVAPFLIAGVYAWRGQRSRALDWVERAYALHDPRTVQMKHNPILRSLRGEPRWDALLRKMNLPPD